MLVGALADDKKLPLWHARNAQSVLDKLFDQCASDPACHAAFPALRQEWGAWVLRLQSAPVVTSAVVGGHERPITLRAGPFAEAFRGLLYSAGDQIHVPSLVHGISQGSFAPFFDRVLGKGGNISAGLYLSITCSEDTPRITPDERDSATAGTFLGTYRIDEQAGACRVWNVPRAPDAKWAAPHPDVPVLLVAGTMDAVTAPAWAREIASLLPRSRVIEIPGLGHFPDSLDHMECLDEMLAAFYQGAQPDRVDTECVKRMSRGGFALP